MRITAMSFYKESVDWGYLLRVRFGDWRGRSARRLFNKLLPPPEQAGPPPADQPAPAHLTPQQLQDLVAPIALYPDALVAQILEAASQHIRRRLWRPTDICKRIRI